VELLRLEGNVHRIPAHGFNRPIRYVVETWSSGREERVVRDYYMDDEEVMDTVRRYCV